MKNVSLKIEKFFATPHIVIEGWEKRNTKSFLPLLEWFMRDIGYNLEI